MTDVLDSGWLSQRDIHGMYDKAGFLKPWYFMLRLFEEVTRSKRYERPVTLLTMGVIGAATGEEEWLVARLRASDLLCKDALGRYFVLLPETTAANAADLSNRLLTEFGGASVATATLPGEVDRFSELADWIAADATAKAA